MVKFQEVRPFSGVDESATPTGIVVPLGPGLANFNAVRLTGGQGIRPQHPGSAIKINELSAAMVRFNYGGQVSQGDRVFMITGNLPVTDVRVQAVGSPGQGSDTLRVAVLKQRAVKLSIRPVQVRDPQTGALVFHSKVPIGDINAMVDQMNAVWTPQANVVFTLVSSAPAPLIDEARIGNLSGKSLGPAFQKPAPLPDDVNMDVFWDLLAENRDQNAELTMFLVQWCSQGTLSNTLHPHGETDWRPEGAAWGISLISDWRDKEPALMAHEAGHFLGKLRGHTDDIIGRENEHVLMHNGGASYGYQKIPFNDVINRFNKPS